MSRRAVPVLTLIFLAPWVGEYLLGNLSVRTLPLIVFLMPMYGGGALLIREVVRRAGRGYPAMLLLGAAYGIAEAGLADLTLFNPPLAGAGFDLVSAVSFVAGHAVWSVTVPIAIAERVAGPRGRTPWLSGRGLVVTAVVYVAGCALIFSDAYDTVSVRPSAVQVAAVLVAIAAFVAWGLLAPSRVRPGTGPVPRPLLLGWGTFVTASVFVARPETAAGLVFGACLLIVAWILVRRWSQAPGWTAWHGYALVAGVLPVYAWLGFVLTALLEPDDGVRWAGNVVFAVLAGALLVAVAPARSTHRQDVA
ncbi:hypothetical protein AB0F81_25550 [Actinoplanes sp. NPDC024001]|uniref:hypothetical protein n=1 Tax=Actinoplanes sp. NPDC024001 TaxID=3154598 RepID=UPI0033F57624